MMLRLPNERTSREIVLEPSKPTKVTLKPIVRDAYKRWTELSWPESNPKRTHNRGGWKTDPILSFAPRDELNREREMEQGIGLMTIIISL